MAFNDSVPDAALNEIATSTRVDLCSQEPTNITQATSTYTLANYTLTAGAGNGDWVIANGDTSGRKITMTQQTGNNATATGTATHLAFTDGSGLLITVPVTSQSVTSGNPVTLNAVDVLEIRDPS